MKIIRTYVYMNCNKKMLFVETYVGRPESKERFAIQRYLLIIEKKQIMQVLSHNFTYFSTFCVFLCSLYCLFCDVSFIVCVYMCTEQLPPGGYPIAVKYISYYIIVTLDIEALAVPWHQLLIPSSYQTAAWLFNQSMTACCSSSSSVNRLPARCSFIFEKR